VTSTYAPTGGDPTAVVGRRIGAYALDFVLVLLVLVPVCVWSFQTNAIVDRTGNVECAESGSGRSRPGVVEIDSSFCLELDGDVHYLDGDGEDQLLYWFYGTLFTVQVLNLVVLQALTGASVGKLLVGLRVVRLETGERAGFGWTVLRWILLFIDGFCLIPGIVLVSSTKGHRRLGDLAAGTVVVHKHLVGHGPIAVPGLNAPLPYGGPGWGAPGAGPGYGGPSTGYGGQGWGAPQGGWTPQTGSGPTTWPPRQDPAPPGTGTTPSADNPSWDEARQAYIQYDRELSEWMQWDDVDKAWKPISR